MAKKKTMLFFEGARELLLFNDGSFAYLEIEKNSAPLLKQHITRMNMSKVFAKGKSLQINVIDKKFKFIFDTDEQAKLWATTMNSQK